MIDQTDRKIINLLNVDARKSLASISGEIGISAAAIHQRIKKLEEQGVILGTTLVIDYTKLGLLTSAYVGVFLESADLHQSVVAAFDKVPEIVECSFTTGTYSLLIKIMCKDNHHLMEVLSQKIQCIDGVMRTETFIELEHPIKRPAVL